MLKTLYGLILLFHLVPCSVVYGGMQGDDLEIEIGNTPIDVSIEPNIKHFRDDSKLLTLNEYLAGRIHDPKFKQKDPSSPRANIWFTVKVRNTVSKIKKAYFYCQIPLFYAKLSYFDNGALATKEAGESVSQNNWDIDHNRIIFKIEVPPHATRSFHFVLQTDSASRINWRLVDFDKYTSLITKEKFLLGVFTGLILIILCYYLFLYFSIWERSYLFYVLHLASFLMVIVSVDGNGRQYLWSNNPYWNLHSMAFFGGLSPFFGLFFMKYFLDIPDVSKVLNTVLNCLVVITFIHTVASLFGDPIDNNLRGNIIGAVIVLFMLAPGVYCLIKGFRRARFYILANVFLILGVFAFTLANLKIFDSSLFSTYGMHIGVTFEVLFFSLALADRVNIERRQKIAAQKDITEKLLAVSNRFAHEVNNPLAIIDLSVSQIVEIKEKNGEHTVKIDHKCIKVRDQVARIQKVIQIIQSLSADESRYTQLLDEKTINLLERKKAG